MERGKTTEVKIKVHPAIAEALAAIVEESKHSVLHMGTTEELVGYVLMTLADGYVRPGSWERSILEKMGLVS